MPGAPGEDRGPYAFIGQVSDIVMRHEFQGHVVRVDSMDAWWVIRVRVVRIESGRCPEGPGKEIAFLVHSPMEFLGDFAYEYGRSYEFSVLPAGAGSAGRPTYDVEVRDLSGL